MTIQDFVSLSGEVLTQYYDNNITPFLDACCYQAISYQP